MYEGEMRRLWILALRDSKFISKIVASVQPAEPTEMSSYYNHVSKGRNLRSNLLKIMMNILFQCCVIFTNLYSIIIIISKF